MRIITISREFGSGGRELGKRLAEHIGFDYYDREIISAIAKEQGMDEEYIERTVDSHEWRTYPVTFRHSFSSASIMGNPQISLLLEQKRVIEKIAELGRDCVIVGRNADVILEKYQPFSIFVCAEMDSRIRRCTEKADDNEKISSKQMEQNIKRIDKNRSKTRELICGYEWGNPATYDVTVNTTYWNMNALVPAVEEFAMRWFGGNNENTII